MIRIRYSVVLLRDSYRTPRLLPYFETLIVLRYSDPYSEVYRDSLDRNQVLCTHSDDFYVNRRLNKDLESAVSPLIQRHPRKFGAHEGSLENDLDSHPRVLINFSDFFLRKDTVSSQSHALRDPLTNTTHE